MWKLIGIAVLCAVCFFYGEHAGVRLAESQKAQGMVAYHSTADDVAWLVEKARQLGSLFDPPLAQAAEEAPKPHPKPKAPTWLVR